MLHVETSRHVVRLGLNMLALTLPPYDYQRIKHMQKTVLLFCFLLYAVRFMSFSAGAQDVEQVVYNVSWPEPHTHYYHVHMQVDRSSEGVLTVRVPAWRPGRYIIQNYARYFVDVAASDAQGNALPLHKIDKDSWRIEAGDTKTVHIRYRNYARVLDAGESYLDATEAYINPITVLMYVPGAEMTRSTLVLDKPADWNVATALDYDYELGGYPATSYHELVDSPFIISPDFETLSFEHEGATYELVFQGEGNYDAESVVDDIRRIAKAQTDIMRITPFERYVFLYHLLPVRFGHGVEHKNSTSIVVGPADFNDRTFYYRLLGVTSHELFHVWNVERIRPEAIYYPDYSKENYTSTMWVYEGITSYYTSLTIAHAGLRTPEQYLANLARLLRGYDGSFGRKVTSVAMTSWNSWISPNAPPHTMYSFYTAGNVLGLLLDLEIRHRTSNEKSLDDVFRYLYAEYAEKDRGVPEEGFQEAVETIAGSAFDAFFESFVYGTEDIDYNAFFSHAGLQLSKDWDNRKASLGVNIQAVEAGAVIRRIDPGSPIEALGLSIDDLIVSIGADRITEENYEQLLEAYKPGDMVDITYFSRGELSAATIALTGEQPDYSIQKVAEPTALQSAIYESWLIR